MNNYINLKDCNKCENFINQVNSDTIICNRLKDMNVTIIAQPANYIKGFTNDMWLVRCNK